MSQLRKLLRGEVEGKDVVFMTCSEDCGRAIKRAFDGELEHGLDFYEDDLSAC